MTGDLAATSPAAPSSALRLWVHRELHCAGTRDRQIPRIRTPEGKHLPTIRGATGARKVHGNALSLAVAGDPPTMPGAPRAVRARAPTVRRAAKGGSPARLPQQSAIQSQPDGASHESESHRGVEGPQPPAACQPLPDTGAEDDPSMRGYAARDEEHDDHEQGVHALGLANREGRRDVDRECPCLGVYPLERDSLHEGKGPVLDLLTRPARRSDAPCVPEDHGETDPTENLHDSGKRPQNTLQAHCDSEDHQGKADRHAHRMGNGPPPAVVGARGAQHRVVGSRSAGQCERDAAQRREIFEIHRTLTRLGGGLHVGRLISAQRPMQASLPARRAHSTSPPIASSDQHERSLRSRVDGRSVATQQPSRCLFDGALD